MNRYFFEISFIGTNYSGWQRQQTAKTIQQTIEEVFDILLQHEVRIHGCGRTDTGVHASQYYFHLDIETEPSNFLFRLNRMLPKDIAILNVSQVHSKANAQKNATSRTYAYRISHIKNPFNNLFTTSLLEKLDHHKINNALSFIIGTHDFRNFCKRPESMNNTLCSISEASACFMNESQTLIIKVTGNRFLHHMMRLLVGNLVKVGNGHLSMLEFQDYIDLKTTPLHFELAPAQGLSLIKVEYDFEKLKNL